MMDSSESASKTEIIAALTENDRPEHLFVLQQNLALFHACQAQFAACDRAIEAHVQTLAVREGTPTTRATAPSVSMRVAEMRPRNAQSPASTACPSVGLSMASDADISLVRHKPEIPAHTNIAAMRPTRIPNARIFPLLSASNVLRFSRRGSGSHSPPSLEAPVRGSHSTSRLLPLLPRVIPLLSIFGVNSGFASRHVVWCQQSDAFRPWTLSRSNNNIEMNQPTPKQCRRYQAEDHQSPDRNT